MSASSVHRAAFLRRSDDLRYLTRGVPPGFVAESVVVGDCDGLPGDSVTFVEALGKCRNGLHDLGEWWNGPHDHAGHGVVVAFE